MNASLFIRVDANKKIGLGHFMRCFALAQAWKLRRGNVLFISNTKSRNVVLEQIIEKARMEIVYISAVPGSSSDAAQTAALVDGRSWLVVDGYHFKSAYQKTINEKGVRQLCFDDLGRARRYYADIVLNQDVTAKHVSYKYRLRRTKVLLGTKYIVLRQDFMAWKGIKRHVKENARKILVVMGGSDFQNVTLKVIKGLKLIATDTLEVRVIVGAANPHSAVLEKEVKEAAGKFKLVRHTQNMSAQMAWADMCISAGGSTCWELAFMGLPTLVVPVVAGQIASTRNLQVQGIVKSLGMHSKLTPKRIAFETCLMLCSVNQRTEMSANGRSLVDGEGINRVLERMGA